MVKMRHYKHAYSYHGYGRANAEFARYDFSAVVRLPQ
jgi:hypothetical protein